MIYVNQSRSSAMFNIYFNYENQALNVYMPLFLSLLLVLVVSYILFLERVCLTDFSALIYCYLPSDLVSYSNYFLSLNQMGY